jgi:diguanylate cyclase (GGDEF)-like protein
MTVSLVLNFFIQAMFWFDAAGNYHAGQFRYVALALQVLLFLSIAVAVLTTGARKGRSSRRRHLAIGIYAITMMVMVILQVIYPLMPMYSIGCLLGSCILHTFVVEDLKEDRRMELEKLLQRERERDRELGSARHLAYTDQLTGVKNTHAYVEAEAQLNRRIADEELQELGVIVFDVNNLKKTNDTKGHEAGDQLIVTACRMICRRFKHSPVFRIGGDEFVALLEGEDYQNREELLSEFDRIAEVNRGSGKAVVASGLATFRPGEDHTYRKIFERADRRMYERKVLLKASGPI